MQGFHHRHWNSKANWIPSKLHISKLSISRRFSKVSFENLLLHWWIESITFVVLVGLHYFPNIVMAMYCVPSRRYKELYALHIAGASRSFSEAARYYERAAALNCRSGNAQNQVSNLSLQRLRTLLVSCSYSYFYGQQRTRWYYNNYYH